MKPIRHGLIKTAFGFGIWAAATATYALPGHAERLRAAAATDTVHALFALRGRDDDGLEKLAAAVSNPASPDYGRYLSFDESVRRFGPAPGAARAVVRYLLDKGAEARIDASGLFVEATLSARQIGEIGGVTLARYRDPNGRGHFLAPDRPAIIPSELQAFVVAINGLDETPLRNRPAKRPTTHAFGSPDGTDPNYFKSARDLSGTPSGCPAALDLKTFTPNQWLRAYGLDQLQANGFTGKGERIGLIELDGYLTSDLQAYTGCFGLPLPTPSITLVPPATGPTFTDSETNLDLSIVAAAAPGLDQIDIFVMNNGSPKDIGNAILKAVRAGDTVISLSMGFCEANLYPDQTALTEKALRYAALAGVTVVIASGDTGVAGCAEDWSLVALPGTDIRQADNIESVQYPASSAWATAAGGTNLILRPDNTIKREIVWNDWTQYTVGLEQYVDIGAGTGGLSVFSPQPFWQTVKPPIPHLNARIVPDIALLADTEPGYAVYLEGTWLRNGGTSAAAPLMAAATAVMNQARQVAGRPRLGFLNPLLYRIGNDSNLAADAYHDVRHGNNDVAWQVYSGGYVGPDDYFGAKGPHWRARAGYDAATGWGSPKFPGFLEASLKVGP